jgi:HAMP domain-containing protein
MTEETKQLIINLRWLGNLGYEPEIAQPCLRAADEIERLAAEVKRLDNLLDAYVERER